jgi:UDP-N-acetylglucosamine 2-epimerase (non-hydrolysing)
MFGTRPEVIKMAPVIHELLKKKDRVQIHVVCSGQHRELLYPLIDWFELKVDFNLDVMEQNQNLNMLSSKLMREFSELLRREHYDCIIAQGDTTTVLMSAIAAFYEKVPFAHVEAGLRTFDRHLPFPEEMNRVLTGKVASLHFAPTQSSSDNLIQDGVPSEEILITGNTVIDALYFTKNKLGLGTASNQQKKTILVTAHRRENLGEPLERICRALLRIAKKHQDVSIVFPVHPNPKVRATVNTILGDTSNISLVEPLSYDKLVALMAESYLVITDSGGLQEEAPALCKPVLVLREETERPELVALGGAVLVGNDENKIVNLTEKLLTDETAYQDMVLGYSPYGSGDAAELIVEKIVRFLTEAEQQRLSSLVVPEEI